MTFAFFLKIDRPCTLKVLVRVVETASFSAVACERGPTQAAAAPQIAWLEEHFGVRLFHRTTRKLKPDARWTDAGRPVLEGVDEIKAALGWQSGSSVGLARVGATLTASRFLCTTSARLAVDQPGLKIEFVVSDRFGDMIEEHLDLALHLRRDHQLVPVSRVIPASSTVSSEIRRCGSLPRGTGLSGVQRVSC
jgi:DNA-binding transcriptional LysR family regulator